MTNDASWVLGFLVDNSHIYSWSCCGMRLQEKSEVFIVVHEKTKLHVNWLWELVCIEKQNDYMLSILIQSVIFCDYHSSMPVDEVSCPSVMACLFFTEKFIFELQAYFSLLLNAI